MIRLNAELQHAIPDLKITLTDFFPNIPAFQRTVHHAANMDYISYPVDARSIPNHLKGLRTQFLSLHHFEPMDARRIIQNAVDMNAGIAIFEAQERSVLSILAMLLSPISVLLTTPFIRPFRISRLLFTYLLPIVPLFVLWDGVVSALRTYSIPEMERLLAGVQGREHYDWDIQRIQSGPGVILYLIGTPKK